jgi:anaphase-promoting complex subunit 5
MNLFYTLGKKVALFYQCCHQSAGAEGFDSAPSSSGSNSSGRYEIGLIYLGMMHLHFGHPKQALQVSMRKISLKKN